MERRKNDRGGEGCYPIVIDTKGGEASVFDKSGKQNSVYPTVDADPRLNQGREFAASSSLYPSVSVEDITGNGSEALNMGNSAYSPSAPCEATEEVLIRIGGAIVHLIDKEQSFELANGDFTLVRLLQGDNPVAVFARIGDDIQWPLAKDETAVKLDKCHYFFSLRVPNEAFNDEEDDKKIDPSETILNYGLTFAAKGQDDALQELDRLLKQYSYFSEQKVSEKSELLREMTSKEVTPSDLSSDQTKQLVEEKSTAYWTTLAPNVEDYSHSMARAIASGSGQIIRGILWCGDVTVDRLRWGNEFMKKRLQPGGQTSEISPQAIRRIKRAKRVSKMSHKIAKGVLGGVVKVSGVVAGSVINSKAGKKFFSLLPGEVVLASFDSFVKMFDAVEVAGKNVLRTSSEVTTEVVTYRYGEEAGQFTKEGLGAAGHMIGTAWTVSKIRNALNPKSALKPSTLAKSAVKEAAKSAAKDVAKSRKKEKKDKNSK